MAGELPYIQNAQSVRELLANFYGTPFITEPHDADFVVNQVAIPVLQTLYQRVQVLIQNTGTSNLWLNYKRSVAVGAGFVLAAGKSYVSDWYYDGDLLMRQIYLISDADGGSAHVLERVLQGV